MKKLASFPQKLTLALAAAAFALSAAAESELVDLVVAAGESVTLSTSGTWRSITVNGTLTIDNGVDVLVDDGSQWHNASVVVGDGNGASGKLIVRNGAKLRPAAGDNDGRYFFFGKDGGHADVEIDNATLRCWRVYFARSRTDANPSSANLVMRNGAQLYAVNSLSFLENASCSVFNDEPAVTVTLESSALLKTWWFNKFSHARSDIHFRGGYLQAECIRKWNKGDLVFDGTPDSPIGIVFPSSSNGQGGYWDGITYYYHSDDESGVFRLTGTCDFVKYGSGGADEVLATVAGTAHLSLEYTGATRVKEGGFGLRANLSLTSGSELCLEGNGKVDLCGCELSVAKVTGSGEIVSTTNGAGTVRFTVPQGQTASCTCGLAANVKVAKSGAGTFELVSDACGGIRVDEGTVKLLNRAETGYSQYRFKVDSAYGDTFDGMHIAELRLYSGETDVTRPYASLSHALGNAYRLFDGVIANDNNKWWFQCHYQTQPVFTEAYVDVIYGSRLPVTTYAWVSAGDTAPGAKNCRDPGSWRLYGRDRAGEWRELSRVGHREYTLTERNKESKLFDLECNGRVEAGPVVVVKGATLELADDVTLACSTYDCNGALRIGTGARLVVGDDTDSTIAYPNFTGSVSFEKTGSGTVKLLGPVTGIGELVVSGGTLKPMAGCDAPWLQYKFVLKANAGNGDFQFGEIALYDRNGERVNLTANLSACSVEGNDGWKLFDGDLSTCNWKQTAPLVAEFTLKGASSVASYLYAPTSLYNNWHKAPSDWEVYARQSASDEWTLLDARQEKCDQAYDKTWNGYNKGRPYLFTVVRDATQAAFDPTVAVFVKDGATLDLSDTAIALAALRCDPASAGTIKAGALAASGTLDLSADALPRGAFELPLTFVGTTLPANLSGWTVTLNGAPTKLGLRAEDGKLKLIPSGLWVIVK